MMSSIHDYIVRISTPTGQGGGFVFSPKKNSTSAYIITARHCLTDTDDVPIEKRDIVIEFLLESGFQSYTLTDADCILLGENFDKEDIGLIIIPIAVVPDSINLENAPKLCAHPQNADCIEITGIPKALQNSYKRTLYRLTLLSDRDNKHNMQLEVADPITGHYNSDNLVEGYSGSPIVLKTENADFVCGIFHSYETVTKRVLGIDLHIINVLLGKNGHPELPLPNIETNLSILNAISKLDSNTERILKRIRNNVGTLNFKRSTLTRDLIGKIKDSKFTIVYGKPGVGKSAIVKEAFQKLGESFHIIALQGEQLDKTSLYEIFHQNPFGFETDLGNVLSSNFYTADKIILIDSVEKLLETKNADTILDFFELIANSRDIKIVMTCRSYAVESLKVRFLRQFPIFSDFIIPVLGVGELKEVQEVYPQLKSLIEKDSLAEVLKIPFNLDLAAGIVNGTVMENVNSEMAFRNVMWDYVIEGEISGCEAVVKRLSGEIFMSIAVSRSIEMSTYAFVENADDSIIERLFRDGIIDKEPIIGKCFAASHDIFEDWALERHIEQNFQKYALMQGRYDRFYAELGISPAIRRAFRIWFSEKMQISDPQANDLLQLTLAQEEVEYYWKDEILASVLQSAYSKNFLEINKAFLFQHNFKYFERSIFVLKVACQKLDLTCLNLVKPEKKILFYHNINLMPYGDGWGNMITFIHDNIPLLDVQFPTIIEMLLVWKKGINENALSVEAEKAGKILLAYFNSFEADIKDKNRDYSSQDHFMGECIRLLFKLSKLLLNDVRILIEKAFEAKIDNSNYRLRKLYDTIIKFVISGDESKIICDQYPDLVFRILEKKWFYYPPSDAEIKINQEDNPNDFISLSRRENKENSFGVQSKSESRYFPASPYQTPVLNLFARDPLHTLDFIVKFLNHCTLAYIKSDYDTQSTFRLDSGNRTIFEMQFADGSVNKLHASATLWIMFRGTYIAVPDVITSVLMALEEFLLRLAAERKKVVGTSKDEPYLLVWNYAFKILLEKSNNVMGTSVLVSVAMAYPEFGVEHIIPLLCFKEIYQWDVIRYVKDSSALSPIGTMRNSIEHQKKLYKFQKLQHREKMVRDLVRDLSAGGKLAQEIHKVLDVLYAYSEGDSEWKVQVSYMDYRTYKVKEKVDEGYVVEATVEESLQSVVDKQKKELEEASEVSSAANWSFKKFKYTTVEDDSYEKWQSVFTVMCKVDKDAKINAVEKNTGLTAGIGLRDYLERLNKIEKKWCIDKICDIIEYDHRGPVNKSFDIKDFSYTSLDIEAAYSVLPLLMHISDGEAKSKFKKYIFYTLLSDQGSLEKRALFKSIHSYLWKEDSVFMMNCIGGIIHYSSFSSLFERTRHISIQSLSLKKSGVLLFFIKIVDYIKGFWKEPEATEDEQKISRNEIILEVRRKYDSLIESIGTGDNVVSFDSFEINSDNIDDLIGIHKLIPYDTNVIKLQDFCLSLLKYILDNLDNKTGEYGVVYNEFDYQAIQDFGEFSAKYILYQKPASSAIFFETLTDRVFESSGAIKLKKKTIEFISQRLEDIHLAYLQDESRSQYWVLFEKFIDKCTIKKVFVFEEQLLFNRPIFDSFEFNGNPLSGKKMLFLDFIRSGADLSKSVKFISGIGFTEMMPDALEVISDRISGESVWNDETYYFDKLIIQAFHDSVYRKRLQSHFKLRKSFIEILDFLINKTGSASAYIIREDFVFSKYINDN